MRGAAPDTMSLPSLRKPLVAHRATGAMASSSGLGPLSQWQLTGENYIDSEQRKRHRSVRSANFHGSFHSNSATLSVGYLI